MDRHGDRAGTAAVNEGSSSSLPPEIDEEAMWQMSFREGDGPRPYPEHPGEPACANYIRTGLCRFGMMCKFNHPADRKLAVPEARIKGGYPERVGQLDCQYFMKSGTCKFGPTCKFHHPRDEAGIAGQVQLNV